MCRGMIRAHKGGRPIPRTQSTFVFSVHGGRTEGSFSRVWYMWLSFFDPFPTAVEPFVRFEPTPCCVIYLERRAGSRGGGACGIWSWGLLYTNLGHNQLVGQRTISPPPRSLKTAQLMLNAKRSAKNRNNTKTLQIFVKTMPFSSPPPRSASDVRQPKKKLVPPSMKTKTERAGQCGA